MWKGLMFKASQLFANRRFRLAVGVNRHEIVELVRVLLSREDDEPQQIVLHGGIAAEILNTQIETPYTTVAISGSYTDAAKFVIAVKNPNGDWQDVLLANNWEESLKPGDWQRILKAAVKTFVTNPKNKAANG
jgi:hypothetical protein